MKMLKKLMALIVAAFMTFASYVALPVAKLVALASEPAQVIKVGFEAGTTVPTELDLTTNTTIAIPTATLTGIEKASASRVYNGAGRVVFDSRTNTTFAPKAAGKYTIVYGYYTNEGTENEEFVRVSGDYTINVTGKKATLTLKENDEFFMPSKVPATDGTVVNIPMPDIVSSDGSVTSIGEEGYNVEVTVKNVASTTPIETTLVNNHRELTLTNESVKGKYEVRYKYTTEDVILIKYFEVVDPQSINTENLGYKASLSSSSWSEKATRYRDEAITLPTVTVKDANDKDVTSETYNVITVKYIEVSGENKVEQTSNEYFVLDGYKLTLKAEAVEAGSHYEINYTVKDYFGKVIETYNFKILNATTWKNNIKVYAVDNYTAETEENNIVSIRDVIPNTFYFTKDTKDTLVIPAIFATDNYGSEFDYTRTVREPGKTSATTIEADAKQKTSIQVKEEGKYTITFTAKSTKTKLSQSVTYTVIAKDASTLTNSDKVLSRKPEITLPVVPQYAKANETINIALPTVADKDENGDVVDENITITASDNLVPVYENHQLTGYTFTGTDAGVATLTFTATNDNGASESKSVDITVLKTDNVAPTLAISGEGYTVDESVVSLPSVVFEDENNDSAEKDTRFTKVYVQVFDPNGNEINGVTGIRYNHTTHTVYGGSFVAGLTGQYTLVYTAIDAFNNSSSIAIVTANVKGTSKYVQAGLKTDFPTQIEPGEEVQLPEPKIQVNGKVNNDIDYTIEVVSESGNYMLTESNVFSATTEGQYEFVYTVNGEEISAHYIITVSDTVAPTLEVDTKNIPDTVVSYNSSNPEEIYIPLFHPTDNVKLADYNIKITKNGGEFQTLTKQDLIDIHAKAEQEGTEVVSYSFKPTGDGTYKVEYNATDTAGNKATAYSFEINVGDVDTPEIKFTANVPASVDKDYKLTFKESDILVTDSSDADYTVSVRNKSGDEVSNTGADGVYAYKLESAGEYTLTITADDHKGHTETYTKTITVSSEEYNSTVNTTVIGIILIVVSVLILAGVIIFFIRTRDRKPKIENTTND